MVVAGTLRKPRELLCASQKQPWFSQPILRNKRKGNNRSSREESKTGKGKKWEGW
jgi:hypothetical protein